MQLTDVRYYVVSGGEAHTTFLINLLFWYGIILAKMLWQGKV